MSYDLAVAYRIYPGVSKEPLVHEDDKYKLAELCLASFRAALGTLNVKLYAILDGCPDRYVDLFHRYFDAEDLEIVRLDGVGNFQTFEKQIDLLSQQRHADFVYFAEDDYFYLPNSFPGLIDFAHAHDDAHFLTPFDHLDYYTLDLHHHLNEIRFHNGRHWRTANSTTLTFLTRSNVLQETKALLRTFARRNWDVSIFLSLTKLRVFNPALWIRSAKQALAGDASHLKFLGKAWWYGWRQHLIGPRYKLWVPIHSTATHMESTTLAPGIDWESRIAAFSEQHLESDDDAHPG